MGSVQTWNGLRRDPVNPWDKPPGPSHRGHDEYPTAEADRGRHPGYPSFNILAGGPGSLAERLAASAHPHPHDDAWLNDRHACHAAFCNSVRSFSLRSSTSTLTPTDFSSHNTARKAHAARYDPARVG